MQRRGALSQSNINDRVFVRFRASTGDSFIKEGRSWLSLQALEPSSSSHNTHFCFGYEPAPGELEFLFFMRRMALTRAI
jgi:hypothetical protein